MRGHAGIAFVQSMGRRLADKSAADPLLQFILLTVGHQQIPQLHPVIAEQTEVQLAEEETRSRLQPAQKSLL